MRPHAGLKRAGCPLCEVLGGTRRVPWVPLWAAQCSVVVMVVVEAGYAGEAETGARMQVAQVHPVATAMLDR